MKQFLKNKIIEFILTKGENYFEFLEGNGYKEPLIQFASTKDPLFDSFKEIIGEHHRTPTEAFEIINGNGSFKEGTVISIAMPFTEEVLESNRLQKDWPSDKWALMRTFGSNFTNELSDYIIELLDKNAYKGVCPSNSKVFKKILTDEGPSSNWFERYVAYVAGLGTFSLNNRFITEKGIAVRFLSIITDLVIDSDDIKAENHNENCLYYKKGKCKQCIKKCPVNALSKNGIDKMICRDFGYGKKAQDFAISIGPNPEAGSGCGLCQVGVPCEGENPTIRSKSK